MDTPTGPHPGDAPAAPPSPPRRAEAAWTALLVGAAVAVACAPLAAYGFPRGHDWPHELVRVAQYLAALREGQLPPAWAPDLYGGFGSPIFLFYAPGFAALASALAVALGSVATGATAALAVAALLSALAAGALAASATATPLAPWRWGTAARAAAILAALQPYPLADALLRNACAERLGLALLPLPLAAALAAGRRPRAALLALAASAAAVVLAHNLTALVMVPLVALAALVCHRAARRALAAVAGGLALGGALAAWLWLPAWRLGPLVRVEELLAGKLDFRGNWPPAGELAGHGALFSPGWLVPAGLLAAAACLASGRFAGGAAGRAAAAALVAAVPLVLLQLPASGPVWEATPLLPLLQFPWRLMGPLGVLAALAGALAFAALATRLPPRWRRAAEAALLLAAALDALPVLRAARPLPEPVRRDLAWALLPETVRASAQAATVGDEYLPRAADPAVAAAATPGLAPGVLAAPAGAALQVASVPGRSGASVRGPAGEGGPLVLARWAFPGWTARSGAEAWPVLPTAGGALAVPLPPGEHRIAVAFAQPAVRRAGLGIAALAAAVWLAVALRPRGSGLLLPAVLGTAAVAGTLQVRSVDTFWHLVAGRWMLEHGELLRHDPFRFTSRGIPWVDHEWGFQLLAAVLERAGGVPALVAARAALLVALAALLWALARRAGATPALAAGLTVAAVLGVRARWFVRPEIASTFLLAVLLLLLASWRRYGGRGRLAAVPALVALWVNLHPGALVAPPLVFAWLLGCRLLPDGGDGGGRRPSWAVVAGVPLAAALALLANPWGWHVVRVPLAISAALGPVAGVNPDWAPLWRAPRPGFVLWALLLAALALALRRRGGRPDLAGGLVAAALVALGVAGVRHQPLAWVAGVPFAASCLAALGRRGVRWRAGRLRPEVVALAACGLAALWSVAPPSRGPLAPRGAPPRFGTGIQPGLYPAAAVARLRALPGLGNLYNDVAFGGYLLWHLHPPRQVFVDSRNEVDPGLLVELSAARGDSRRWQALLARWRIDGALVRYDERPRAVVAPGAGAEPAVEHHTASALLFPREDFALVHWDDVAMLFVRRTPERAAWLAAEEYRFVQPEDWRATLAAAGRDAAFRAGVAAELQRRLREDPGSRRASRLAAALVGG